MLHKYRPPAVIIRPTAKSMPQLDFREALSTPEEKLFSLPAAVPLASAVPVGKKKNIFARQPTTVDQYARSASVPGEKPSEQPVNSNASNPTLPLPPATTGTTTTTPPDITGPGPGTSLFSTVTSLIDGLNTLPSGADALYQSFYQTAVSTTPTKVITRTASRARSSTRRKVSSTQGKLVSRTTTATSVQKSTAQNVQQTPNQTQTFSAIQAPNQMMMGGIGGIGGIGGVGAGLGGTGGLGSVGSGLGGLGGLGGHH